MPGRSGCPSATSTGLLLAGEHYGAPADLLATALRVEEARLPAITARWRRAGYAATGRLGPGPAWCWLTRDGMTATGLGFPALRPALGRLAHIRAVLAARLWLEAGPAWADGQAWWHSERRLRADRPAAGRGGHLPDAEIHWPVDRGQPVRRAGVGGRGGADPQAAGPYGADHGRAAQSPMRYAQVIYLTAPPAGPVVTRAAGSLPEGERVRVVVRDLPPSALGAEISR